MADVLSWRTAGLSISAEIRMFFVIDATKSAGESGTIFAFSATSAVFEMKFQYIMYTLYSSHSQWLGFLRRLPPAMAPGIFNFTQTNISKKPSFQST
eukprot:scaffold4097_cov166-Amphora_coffeaeformis.AAC.10